MKEKILVVGGTGFIGYHVLKNLSLKKYFLYSLSKNNPKSDRKVKNVKYIFCDIINKKDLKKRLSKNFDHIINLSGYIDHSKKKENNLYHYVGSKNLIDIFKLKEIQTFIQIGSSLEYGDLKSPQEEKRKCNPKSWYGLSKLKASKYLEKINKEYKIPYIILRPYQVYGPKQKLNRLIPQTIDSCLKNKSFKCTSGVQKRDFIYIKDFVDLIKKILQLKKIRCEIFNVGSGKPIYVKDVIKKIKTITNSGNPELGSIKMRKDEIMNLYPSIKKVKKYFNWQPKIKLNDGLKKTIKSYEER